MGEGKAPRRLCEGRSGMDLDPDWNSAAVVGDALVRHEGQYLEAAMVDVYGMCFRPLPAIRYGLRCRSRTEVKRYWPLGARAHGFWILTFNHDVRFPLLPTLHN